MFGIVTFLLLVNCYCTFSSPYNVNYLMKREEKLCGTRLMKTLRLVCNGFYYEKEKKSLNDLLEFNDYEFHENAGYEEEFGFPFLQKESVNSFLGNQKRKKNGIVEECCHKPCTKENLQLYCGK